MINAEYRKEILTSAKEARIKEVTEYQVNIDNFRTAMDLIGDNPEMAEFKEQLNGLWTSSIKEQAKAKLMLLAITMQLEKNNVRPDL